MNRQSFDALDLKILRDLSLNARKPYLEIAREYGVSGAAVHQRIQKLLANGVITGSECLIDPTSMGYETCAFVGIYLREPSRSAEVVEELKKIPEIIGMPLHDRPLRHSRQTYGNQQRASASPSPERDPAARNRPHRDPDVVPSGPQAPRAGQIRMSLF